MKNTLLLLMLLLTVSYAFSQEEENITQAVDSLYKEDQFYIGATYNLLVKRPSGVSQSGFSSGFHLGYIKDMPLNTRRNVAIGLGLGISSNSFNQNMLIDTDSDNNYNYSVIDDSETSYSKNKFTTYMIEMPLEFRWRTSTATEYKFWRIYTGLKLGYIIANTSKFIGDTTIKNTNISDFNKLQYGFTISAGYNTWNIHFYYALNSIFNKDAQIDGTSLNMHALKLGLMLYIL
ncbi:PorT family protein [Lacinutrix sp. C3R15]|uniref:porin family protein n=1 Tax=Flavobacteriaceae TaxID=49546 RepID=UPI001C092201|nr:MULTISPECIES: porin family protein [Flavobacteriaceae]MBU2938345.1 PorT family protein [Lacinutrix sp. C3R15]MDO6621660.1 porin family protein [Oceanihabitans sp. 1_MG-2023]